MPINGDFQSFVGFGFSYDLRVIAEEHQTPGGEVSY
jgi:hypothetical protein